MKKFGLIGVAGYIAPRHLKAIKDTGNELVAAADRHDSVGILDQFFPNAAFFTEIERFDRHLDKLRRNNEGIDYLSICSPNHLHDAHIRLALRNHATAICEKPLVLNPWNLDLLSKLEEEFQKRIYTILQLRVHPKLMELKERVRRETEEVRGERQEARGERLEGRGKKAEAKKKYNIDLLYITSRGQWYDFSWKGDKAKSGGLITNLGIHFFDLLIWIFGKPTNHEMEINTNQKAKGSMELEHANVNWFLSIDKNDLPMDVLNSGKSTYRSLVMDGKEIEFSEGFTELHTEVYKRVLDGKGFGLEQVRPSIELVQKLRNFK